MGRPGVFWKVKNTFPIIQFTEKRKVQTSETVIGAAMIRLLVVRLGQTWWVPKHSLKKGHTRAAQATMLSGINTSGLVLISC